MNYKLLRIFLIFFLTANISLSAKTFEEQDSLHVFIGSGENQLLIPVSDSIAFKNPQIEVESSNPDLLEILDNEYIAGQSFTILKVQENGISGQVSLTINMIHSEGTFSFVTDVFVVPYNNPGIAFEIHDIIFWQEAIPLVGVPVFDTIIQSSAGPYNQLNYDNIPLTVNLDCSGTICTGHDFFTSLYKGYFTPPTDGTYFFYIKSQDKHTLWFSDNEKMSDAKLIAARTTKHGNVGTEVSNGLTKSAPQQLLKGKIYAFYATQWIIHSTIGGVLYEGPGITMDYIPGENTMPIYDVIKPSAPVGLELDWRSSNEFAVNWKPSTDDNNVSGYQLYLNGIRVNDEIIKKNSFRVDSLTEETKYQLVVTALDQAGNESFVSNTLEVETHKSDNEPPTPPQQVEVLSATGLALQIKWTGASDAETEVIGYKLYIDGVLYNTDDLIFTDSIIIHKLLPETTYLITIESVDAGINVSEKSEPFSVSTIEFDATGPNLGERVGKVIVINKNTSWNEGIGLNGPYEDGDMVNNSTVRKLVSDFQAGIVRWGSISANSKSFLGSVGTGKANTYAKMLNLANEIDARFALTVGVQDGLDYRMVSKTFLYLLEYLAGDASTTYGAIRASEGFTEPLLQKGKGILLEFGNEVWGGAAHDAQIGADYAAYAKWVRKITEIVKSSPYYDPEKIIMVYSGRNPHPNNSSGINTKVLTGDRGHAENLAVSGYLGGNLNYDPDIPAGDSELDYYKNSIDLARNNLDGFLLTMKEMLSLTGTIKTFYLYESNMTTTSYNGRFGQAIVMTDYLAASMNYGSILPSLFHLTGGQWRITQPADNYRKLPLYNTGKYFNRFCKGNILQTEFISNNKITNALGQEIDYDPIGTYSYNNGETFSVLLINRDFENDFTIQMELPDDITFLEEATVYTIWEDDFNSYNTNIDSLNVLLSEDLLISVPKHAMVIVAIKGEDPDYEKLPIGYYDRKRPESLQVFSTRNYIIDTHRGTDVISTEVLPSDAFSAVAVLDIIENTTESIITPLSKGRMHIKASGKCRDEGIIKIHVYAADNHELSDTVTVLVSNQGIDCPSTSITDLNVQSLNLFYPNPVTEKIVLNKNLDSQSFIKIFDSIGRVVYQKFLNSGYEIPVAHWQPGLYVIQVINPDKTSLSGKIQKL